MGHDINGLHHVGHIVHDMDQAMERYRRLGFTVAAPACPVMPTTPAACPATPAPSPCRCPTTRCRG